MTDKQKLKIIRSIGKLVDTAINISMILLLLIGCYLIYDSYYVFNSGSSNKIAGYKPDKINSQTLKDLSKDCIAWITIDDTNIDFPVMQGKDNSEYLNKDPYGDYSLLGSIFLDSQNKYDFTDKYNLVHGHHAANAMFGHMDQFENETYFNKHLDGKLIVGDKEYKIRLFAFGYTDAFVDVIYTPVGNYPLNYIKNNSEHYLNPEGENLIVLSTCRQPNTTRRQYLAGVLLEENNSTISKGEK